MEEPEEEITTYGGGIAVDNVRLVYHKEKKGSLDLTQPITFVLIVVWLGTIWFKGGIPIFSKKT
ncbi:MAG: hypothetical protein C4329_10435 [Chitinophagaceae bacterium]